MSEYFHLRAVPPSALRNSTTWMQRLFEDDWETVRERIGRHREEMLDGRYLDHALLYAGPGRRRGDFPGAQVVLGGRPLPHPAPGRPPFRVLTAAQAQRVASFLAAADFDALWHPARAALLPRYGGSDAEPWTRGVFASAHRDLRAFYEQTALSGDAVVKWVLV
ncbi:MULTISPECIES: DUF1877 family protein [unclassified Streptomyces]|uniref:DUF1877 family protein n=1 Tax=unclassified Streptomyces TaxID=2593676 RepID=UPI001F03A016|nr:MULTISPECIES: DUF1877 family protein [unclassified Streptomyces]MCH0563906.1 DUF1877 family protein [Streptomyces sp. MUM 2J]MCH0570673.1 DUF1877 family protein [Streptomyces sp. MUM 136J]